jgi:hypothetical protein
MKISLKLANGATLEFDGDEAEFQRVAEFLAEPPESLTAASQELPDAPPPDSDPGNAGSNERGSLTPAAVADRLNRIGVANDQERVTVIAQMAVEAGGEGIDYDTLTTLYTELGFPTPAQFPAKTFSNAKASGLVVPVKPGLWRPTYRGANFANGHGRGAAVPRAPARRTTSLDAGGESD